MKWNRKDDFLTIVEKINEDLQHHNLKFSIEDEDGEVVNLVLREVNQEHE